MTDEKKTQPSDSELRHRRTQTRATIYGTIASVLAICGVLGPILLLITRPLLVEVMAAAMAPTVQAQVKRQTEPLAAGFKVLIQQNIDRLRREIAELEQKARNNTMTPDEAREVEDKRIELDGQRAALAAIVSAEREN